MSAASAERPLAASPGERPRPWLPFTAVRAKSVLLVLAVLVAGAAVGVSPTAADTGDYRITFPVHADHIDELYWTDTWGAPRSGGRSHIGVDLMGDKMIPLVAANDSVVTWGEFDNAGGNIVRLRDDAGWEYQYIHINNDTPGTDDGQATCLQAFAAKICDSLSGHRIRKGLRFEAGEFIGFLGDSGNAEWTAPHLHFELYRPVGGNAVPVNPTPYVDRAATDRPPNPAAGNSEAEIEAYRLFEAANGRAPTSDESDRLVAVIDDQGRGAAVASLLAEDSDAARVDRLYRTFFRRSPEVAGLNYWLQRRGEGQSLENIAEWFTHSAEFQQRYGQGTFEDFLDQLYVDVLDREPEESGKEYWLDRLTRDDVNRGTIVVHFSESPEARRLYQLRTERAVLAHLLGQDPPSSDQFDQWSALRAERDLASAVTAIIG